MRQIHLGLGRFHRAHQAVAFQEMAEPPQVTAFSMRSPEEARRLTDGGLCYPVLELSPEGGRTQTIRCIDEALFVQDHRDRLFALMEDPQVTTLTLTVTEKGYCCDTEGRLDPRAVEQDSPAEPLSTPGLIVTGLARRRQSCGRPFDLVSCDNLPENGERLKGALLQWCRHFQMEAELRQYIQEWVGCPNTMVDRIVPALDAEQVADFQDRFGVDANVIATEDFTQWVIEDAFKAGRPDWDQARGVVFTGDVRLFETMKLRLLNAAHSFLAYHGQLEGHTFVHQAMADPRLRDQVQRLTAEEVVPLLTAPAGVNLSEYCRAIWRRFDNPYLPHRLAQIAMDGSQKIPQRILASLLEAEEAGTPNQVLKQAFISWLRYMWLGLRGQRPLAISDPKAEQMKACCESDFDRSVERWLHGEQIFGSQLSQRLGDRWRTGN